MLDHLDDGKYLEETNRNTDDINYDLILTFNGEQDTATSNDNLIKTPENSCETSEPLARSLNADVLKLHSPKIPGSLPIYSNKHLARESLLKYKSQPATRRSSSTSLNQINKFTKTYIIPAAKWAYSPLSYHNLKSKKRFRSGYQIEYSVFRPIKGIKPIENEREFSAHKLSIQQQMLLSPLYEENIMTSEEFAVLYNRLTCLIEVDGISPQRISQGSSGSYFIYDVKNSGTDESAIEISGVFKPKDEEPYGPLSPKWSKWLHRTFFPCFFGRSCLIPNLGYISEVAASVLDQQLLSFIVPHTEILYFRSKSFYYSYWNRNKEESKLPYKIGSFQCYLRGYSEAQSWLKKYPIPYDISLLPESCEILVDLNESDYDGKFYWNARSLDQFREEIEKLVILDYIMRNTDRGLDNWMIKIEWHEVLLREHKKITPIIKIGAIDSGLAFPWKHPDEWRSFPFGWLFLPMSIIGRPFSARTRNHYIPLLTSTYWWETTVKRLRDVFEKDNDFSERMWLKQLSVLKGQAYNVVEVLKLRHAGPLELTRRENLLVWDDEMSVPVEVDNDILHNAMETSIYGISLNRSAANTNDNNTKDKKDMNKDLQDESSPLLLDSSSLGSPYNNDHRLRMSGFEYNLSHNDDTMNDNDARWSNAKKVVIERLDKVKSKPPVFTWC